MTPFYIALGWILSGLLSLAILIEAKKVPPYPLGWRVTWVVLVIAVGPLELIYLMCRLGAVAIRRLRRVR